MIMCASAGDVSVRNGRDGPWAQSELVKVVETGDSLTPTSVRNAKEEAYDAVADGLVALGRARKASDQRD